MAHDGECKKCLKGKFEKGKKMGICFKNINEIIHVMENSWCSSFTSVTEIKARK